MSKANLIEVFKPGVFTPMAGDPIAFSRDDLRAIAEGYDHVNAPAPIVVGHPKTDSPAYGWAAKFIFDEASQKLLAEPEKLMPAFADAVKASTYKKVSLSLFRPDAPNNPKPGSWYPKHIGFLGGAAPAVPGLSPVELAADNDNVATFEFGDISAFIDVASLFRGLRDWIIEKHGREEAERVLPDWTISWVERAARDDAKPIGVAYAEPHQEHHMSKEQEAAFAEREAEVKKREEALEKREAEIAEAARTQRHDAHVAFAEKLADEGKLLPTFVQKVAGALDAVASIDAPAEFAEDGKTHKASALDLVKEVLSGAPKIVTFGGSKVPAETKAADANFSAPPGTEVDAAGLETLARAQAYQQKNPGVSFVDAVKAVEGA